MLVLESPNYHVPKGMTIEEADKRANKLYLVLFRFYPNDETDEEEERMLWRYCRGTETAYNFIKETIIEADEKRTPVDFNESFIVVESTKRTISKPLTVYDFMIKMIETGKVEDTTGFNINDYTYVEDDVDIPDPSELRYGQGDNPEQYTEISETVDGGEV